MTSTARVGAEPAEGKWFRYWLAYDAHGWAIETWRGAPVRENVQVVAYAADYDAAEALVNELNALAGPVDATTVER